MLKYLLPLIALLFASCSQEPAAHRVLIGAKGGLKVFEADGSISWELPWKNIHDVHLDAAGNYYVQRSMKEICKINPDTKEVTVLYNAATSNGNKGQRIEAHAFRLLGDGKLMIAESGSGRIIEVDADGKLLKEVKLKLNKPHPHKDTRLARKIANGNYLIAHENDGFVREYSGDTGKVVWEFELPMDPDRPAKKGHGLDGYGTNVFSALRLPNGNTLIGGGNNHTVLEVSPEKEIVWKLDQYELEDIALGWVTTLEVLENGNYIIGNCHAGPDNPQLFELNPQTKQVLWTLDNFDQIGNNASNSILLDQYPTSLR